MKKPFCTRGRGRQGQGKERPRGKREWERATREREQPWMDSRGEHGPRLPSFSPAAKHKGRANFCGGPWGGHIIAWTGQGRTTTPKQRGHGESEKERDTRGGGQRGGFYNLGIEDDTRKKHPNTAAGGAKTAVFDSTSRESKRKRERERASAGRQTARANETITKKRTRSQ